DDPDHRDNACRAALTMRERLVHLNARLREGEIPAGKAAAIPDLRIGIGINSGVCCVGNLGSEQHFNYSVLGDDVNLASRLEGLTKTHGVDIICSDATRSGCRGLRFRTLGNAQVKGRTASVGIFALEGEGSGENREVAA
ncbi:MAG: adenylate/guanylate cyclase domain-containing protein, partial [Dongiaceae bacterium]